MKSKYIKRVVSEFEHILFELSSSANVGYNEAHKQASDYVSEFCAKKNIHAEEQRFLLDSCIEVIQDWFPNVDDSFVIDF